MQAFISNLNNHKPKKCLSDNLIGEITFDGIKFEVTNIFWILFLIKSKLGLRLILSKSNRNIWIDNKFPKTIWFFRSRKVPNPKRYSECITRCDDYLDKTDSPRGFRLKSIAKINK